MEATMGFKCSSSVIVAVSPMSVTKAKENQLVDKEKQPFN